MRITESQLRSIIREELEQQLSIASVSDIVGEVVDTLERKGLISEHASYEKLQRVQDAIINKIESNYMVEITPMSEYIPEVP